MPVQRTIALLKQGCRFVRENDIATVARAIHSKDAHPVIQFAKYGVCGAVSTIAHNGTWLLLVMTALPALDGAIVDGAPITDDLRFRNTTVANVIGFVFGNTVAYLTNVVWVFQTGRHSRWLEFIYFTAVSAASFAGGLVLGPLLIKLLGVNTLFSQLTFLITSVLVNYFCRKFFIFRK